MGRIGVAMVLAAAFSGFVTAFFFFDDDGADDGKRTFFRLFTRPGDAPVATDLRFWVVEVADELGRVAP